jgi:MoaA/NifB/PqqE/SkfB family radical SAM enzyme
MIGGTIKLKYDTSIWEEVIPSPKNTLQLFITNKCNLRCRGCFYAHKLDSKEEMAFSDYQRSIWTYYQNVSKIILLGGEPTLHPDLPKIIAFNQNLFLPTTIYTNGINLKILNGIDLSDIDIRVGVYGSHKSEKPLDKVSTLLPITIVYMLRKDNVEELLKTAKLAEENYNCRKFYVSSIRDITQTHDFWKDTPETLSPQEYAGIVQEFLNQYQGNLSEIHIARRGVIEPNKQINPTKRSSASSLVTRCRFGNIFPNGEKIICPFDISNQITVPELKFDYSIPCNKRGCLLQKIVLKRKDLNL